MHSSALKLKLALTALVSVKLKAYNQDNNPSKLEFNSFIRGYHAYMDVWVPTIDECNRLERDVTNSHDPDAVAIKLETGTVVGHVPFNLAPILSQFLRRSCNHGTAKVTGTRINRGAGYGLEIPCVYSLFGPLSYVDRLKRILKEKEITVHENNKQKIVIT